MSEKIETCAIDWNTAHKMNRCQIVLRKLTFISGKMRISDFCQSAIWRFCKFVRINECKQVNLADEPTV